MSEEFKNWAEKYRALKFSDLKGQDAAIKEVKLFISNFPKEKKAILLHGPAGVGKTSLAHILKNELDLELFELNASDFRNKSQLESKLKPASEQVSLFKKSKLLLVDEVDGLSSVDKGGLSELLDLIDNTQFPIVITANNIWDGKFSELRNKCKMANLKELDYKEIYFILQEIAKKEHLIIDNQVLLSISVRSNGDARASINDLQTIASDKNSSMVYSPLDLRNKQRDIFQALNFIFKNMLSDETLFVYDSVDMPLEKILLWIEENIPYEYYGEELFNAYEALSIADVFVGRINRQRYWRFLVYQNIFLSAGVSLSKKSPKKGFTHYQKPTRILKIWINNSKNANKKTIIAKYAEHIHCSKAKASKEFNIIKPILKNAGIQKELKLSEQEIKYLADLN